MDVCVCVCVCVCAGGRAAYFHAHALTSSQYGGHHPGTGDIIPVQGTSSQYGGHHPGTGGHHPSTGGHHPGTGFCLTLNLTNTILDSDGNVTDLFSTHHIWRWVNITRGRIPIGFRTNTFNLQVRRAYTIFHTAPHNHHPSRTAVFSTLCAQPLFPVFTASLVTTCTPDPPVTSPRPVNVLW